MYEIKTEEFSGPLEKLLELIREKQLEVTRIHLAQVTADFLNYVKSLEGKALPGTLADFLVVAASLILIKSKVLLPSLTLSQEEEEDIQTLEHRLLLYREYVEAAKHVHGLWTRGEVSHGRPLYKNLGETHFFLPPRTTTLTTLHDRMAALLHEFQKTEKETQTINETIITLEEKIEELLNRFQKEARHSFNTIAETKPKEEIIIMFLALLHLFRDNRIQVEQPAKFGDILITKSADAN